MLSAIRNSYVKNVTTTIARKQRISRLCSKKELTYQLHNVDIAGMRASVQPYSEGEAPLCHTFP